MRLRAVKNNEGAREKAFEGKFCHYISKCKSGFSLILHG